MISEQTANRLLDALDRVLDALPTDTSESRPNARPTGTDFGELCRCTCNLKSSNMKFSPDQFVMAIYVPQ